jgi:hypothetical protein
VDSGNHYIGALKGNQSGFLEEVQANFTAHDSVTDICKGHGRIEKRTGARLSGDNGHPRLAGVEDTDSGRLRASSHQGASD